MRKSEKSPAGWYFLLGVVIVYLITALIKSEAIASALQSAWNVLQNVIPILVLVYIMMVITNHFVTPQVARKYLGKASGLKKWWIALIGGVISMGPIYMWYPLLKDLKEDGASYGFIATFLYNRAIKLPLLPIMIFYFGWVYALVLGLVMMAVSIIQGLIIEKMEGKIL